ncbi:hypothetical protein QRB36_17570 [Mycobacterium marseillense]|uniref:hypothetical protein n=1 Tax=Mycobacterium marseillense TaxID=701042 RepID=UPI002599F40C|nr:hypothetical protein [Mycobacterium marseillense]MDM3975979.1 hypothetical protein [Mycobacterium marseillense]
MQLFAGCGTVSDVRAVFRREVEFEVRAMTDLIADADAFDVIELMRLREFSPVPDPRVVNPDGSALAVEIVAAILLARPNRKPHPRPRIETRPHEQVEELHKRSRRLGRLALFRIECEALLSDDPLADLAAKYQGAVLTIRNLQYEHIRLDHEAHLFDNPLVESLMQKYLGYSYPDVLAVRSAMNELAGRRMTSLRDGTADIVMKYEGIPPAEASPEDVDAFMAMMIPFIFLPADRAVITSADVAASANIAGKTATAVLGSYSQTFDDATDAVTRVFDMLVGTNPFLVTPLVGDGNGNFVATTNDVGLDSLRRIFERAVAPNSSDFGRYDRKVRQVMSERLVLENLANMLGAAPALTGFDYYAPKTFEQSPLLNRDCGGLHEVANRVEGDGLFVIGDVAITVEVKGKSMAAQARRGDVRRLTNDLRATIGDACNQSERLKNLIETNGGIWLGDGTWLNLSHVREIRSVVGLLDDVGPLGTAIGELQRAGLVSAHQPPWIASLHDIAAMAEICERPSEFLLYLRRRTDSGVTSRYFAVDELDLYMLFLNGHLYVEEERDAGKNLGHAAERTLVVDQCHELNIWMAREDIPEDEPAPSKPRFNCVPEVLKLVDHLTDISADGYLRFGADLLGLAGETQQQIVDTVRTMAERTAVDRNFHDAVLSFKGMWGHPTFFLAVAPTEYCTEEAGQRLTMYLKAKSYQLRSDRAYGMLFDERTMLLQFIFANDIPNEDPEMDALILAMGLQQ